MRAGSRRTGTRCWTSDPALKVAEEKDQALIKFIIGTDHHIPAGDIPLTPRTQKTLELVDRRQPDSQHIAVETTAAVTAAADSAEASESGP